MKRNIIIFLLILLVFAIAGAVLATSHLNNITSELNHFLSLHPLKEISHSLIDSVMTKIDKVKNLLYFMIIFFLFLGFVIAINLTRSMTRSINELVKAARVVASGELGYTVEIIDKTEFNELAEQFNAMSISLKEEYSVLKEEIDNLRLQETALREREERYVLAARGADDGIWDWDLRTNKIYFSPRWKSMLGFDEDEITDDPEEWLGRVHPDDRKSLEAKIDTCISGGSDRLKDDYRILNKRKEYRWVLTKGIVIRDQSGKAYRMAGSLTDITKQKVAEEQMLHDAFHDTLTGLPNRSLFLDRLDHLIKSSKRQRYSLYAVLLVDLNRFKVINDSMGHAVGDQLLKEVSIRLVNCLRPGDTVARLGGDEFAILLENIKEVNDTLQIVKRIQGILPEPFTINGHEIFTTASIGIALSSEEHDDPEQILRNADIAMFQAKTRGSANHEVFDPSMHANIIERVRLEADLRKAFERKEFVLHYQPIIDLAKNRITGFEALIRWNHPVQGIIPPMEFIPIAEETGQIFEIGEWIMNEACSQIKMWQQEYPMDPPLKISMNVSAKQFSQPNLSEMIAKVLDRTDLSADSLTLEITESMIMENAETAATLLGKLRNLGVHIHVDDFGTGYSSLSYIHRFPVNALKIDRSFVHDMFSNRESLEIIKAILALASNLNIDVVAEGLEMTEQLTQIRGMKCQYGQGFLFSKPMAPPAVDNWIKNEKRITTH
jgi:diguanylate cyclase (GGDEF)-like protein/PAS domain S-box-containing protein